MVNDDDVLRIFEQTKHRGWFKKKYKWCEDCRIMYKLTYQKLMSLLPKKTRQSDLDSRIDSFIRVNKQNNDELYVVALYEIVIASLVKCFMIEWNQHSYCYCTDEYLNYTTVGSNNEPFNSFIMKGRVGDRFYTLLTLSLNIKKLHNRYKVLIDYLNYKDVRWLSVFVKYKNVFRICRRFIAKYNGVTSKRRLT